jgi:hypothetical protein
MKKYVIRGKHLGTYPISIAHNFRTSRT